MACSSADIRRSSRVADLEFVQRLRANGRMSFAADLDSNECALQSNAHAVIVDVVAAFRDELFRLLLGTRSPVEVDLMRTFGGLGKNTDLVRLDFDEAPGHGKKEPAIPLPIPELPDLEFGKQRRMAGQH